MVDGVVSGAIVELSGERGDGMAVRANPNLKQRALMVAGMAIGLIAILVINQIWTTYDVTIATARRDVQQFTQILEANTDVTLQSVTLILDHAAETARDRHPLAGQLSGISERFVGMVDNYALVHSVMLIDTDGIIREGAVRGPDGRMHAMVAPVDATQQAIFHFHRDTASPEARAFYIARPNQDLLSAERVILITRALHDPHGGFAGVAIVTLAQDDFTRVYTDLLPSRYAAVTLLRRDGVRLARTDGAMPVLTEPEMKMFRDVIAKTPAGAFRQTLPANGDSKLVSYRTLERYPIVIAVIADWFPFMERWWESTIVLVASALFGSLVIAALTWWLIRRIAAEQATKHALMENERRISESQRLAGVGYYEGYVHERELSWSSNMFAIHGLDPATYNPSHDSYIHLVVPEDRERVLAQWAAFAANPEAGSLECRIIRPDGALRHIRYAWRIFEDERGGPARVFGAAQDFTAMRQAEGIIRDDEARLRDIVECSSDYIWELGAQGQLTHFGNGPTAVLNVLTDEKVDQDMADVAVLRRCIKGRVKFRSLLVPATSPSGEARWVRLSGNPRFDDQGRYLGYRGAGTDVTELYLRQERDEANRKAEALGRLASGMAHEINNLLQPIVIYANLGTAQSEPVSSVRQYFARIGLAAERSMAIVKNVLAFARQSPPSRENCNVMDITRETVDLIGGTLAAGTVLEVAEVDDDLIIRVDRTGLAQVFTNLLTNAAEALPAGGRIGVRIDPVSLAGDPARSLGVAPGLYCRVMVEDNGQGIAADQIGKVFDPFFTTKAQGKGTGLGLSVVSGLAKSWGGTVAVESTPGVGTCFTVYVPLVERHLQAAQ